MQAFRVMVSCNTFKNATNSVHQVPIGADGADSEVIWDVIICDDIGGNEESYDVQALL